jgi:hypothetical protein
MVFRETSCSQLALDEGAIIRSRFAKRGDPVDAAHKQHALFVDLRIAQGVVVGLAGVIVPDAVELFGHVFATGLPLA